MIAFLLFNHINNKKKYERANFIIIDKESMTLSQYNFNGSIIQQFKVATGKNFGNKI